MRAEPERVRMARERMPRVKQATQKCPCPICTLDGDDLIEYLLNTGEEREMSLAWLSDEVNAVLLNPKLPVGPRRRLAKALEVCRG